MTTHLEPGALTSPGLLLDRHDLEHLVLQTRTQEEVDDLRLLQERVNQFDVIPCNMGCCVHIHTVVLYTLYSGCTI